MASAWGANANKEFKGNSSGGGNGNASGNSTGTASTVFTDTTGVTTTPPGWSDTVKITKGKNVTVDQTTITWGAVEFTGGTISGINTLNLLLGTSTWSGGEISGSTVNSAGLSIGAGAVGDDAKKISGGGKLKLGGPTSWTADTITVGGGSSLENAAGSAFTTNFDGTITNLDTGTFTNAGSFEKTAGTGTGTTIGAQLVNTGTLKTSAGTLKLTGGGNSAGTVDIASGAKLQVASAFTFDGASFTGAGNIEVASGGTGTFKSNNGSAKVDVTGGTAEFNGAISSVSALSISSGAVTSSNSGSAETSSLAWTGGNVNGKVKSNGSASLSGTSTKTIGTSGDLTLAGTSANTWTGGAVTNQGKLTQSAGSTDIQTSFANNGEVTLGANGGTLKLSGGGGSSGTGNKVTVGSGATVQVASGYTFDTTAFDGAGTVELASATTTFKGASGNAKVALTGGTADFSASNSSVNSLALTSGTITSSSGGSAETTALAWTGGGVNGKVKSTGSASLSGTSTKTIGSSGDLTLAGTSANTWTGGAVTNQGKLTQSAGSTDIQTSFANNGEVTLGANGGTLKLSGGGGSSGTGNKVTVGSGATVQVASSYTFDTTAFDGTGTVELASATTTFKGASGNAKVALTGGTADFSASNSSVNSLALTSGTITSSSGGSAETTALAWTGGGVNGKVKSTGTTSLSGTSTKTIGTSGDLTLAGTGANLWTGGAITNQGKISHTAGSTDVQASFANNGELAIDASGGTVRLSGGGSSSGTGNKVTVGSGGKVQVASSYTFDGTAFSGAGTIDVASGGTGTFKNGSGSANVSVSGGTADFNTSAATLASLALASGSVTTGGGGSAETGALDWSGGSVGGKLKSTGTASLTGANSKTIGAGGELTLAGTGANTWTGGNVSNQGKLKQDAGATDVQTSFVNTGEVAVAANGGTLKLSGGGSSSGTGNKVTVGSGGKVQVASNYSFDGTAFDVSGSIDVTTGGATMFKNNSGAMKVEVTGGTADFNTSTATLSTLSLASGSVTTGAGGAAETGALDWSGGSVGGKLKSNGTASLTGANSKTIGAGGELTLAGTGANTWTGGAVTNQGKLSHNAGTTDVQASFANNGELAVGANGGTLKLSGGGSSSGASNKVSVDTGGKVQVASNYTFDSTTFSGAGSVELASATTTFKSAGGAAKLALSGGNADFSASASTVGSVALASGTITTTSGGSAETGALAWTGGGVNGKVKSNGSTALTGTGTKTIGTDGELTLNGNVANTWSGGAITNQGKIRQTVGSVDIQAPFANAGELNLDPLTGTVRLAGGGSSSGTGNKVVVGSGSKVQVASDYTFDATAFDVSGTVELASATTTFKGASGNAKVALNGGSADFSASTSTVGSLALASGTITSSSGGSADAGALDWTGGNLNGKVKSNGSTGLSGTNAKTIGSGGDLTLAGNVANSWSGGAITNQGKLSQTAGTTDIATSFANNGEVNVGANGGTLKLSGGGSSSGTGNKVSVGNGAKVQVASSYTFDGTALDGTGTVELASATTTFKGANGAAKVALNGGDADFSGATSTIGALALTTGNVTSSSGGAAEAASLDWSGGSVNGKVKSNGSTSVSGANGKTIGSGGDLTLAGTGANTWTGGAVTNQGKLSQTAGTTDVQTSFANSGELAIGANGGTLKLSGGGSSSGNGNKVTIGSGGKVQVAGSYLFDGTAFAGSGSVEVATGGITTFKNHSGSAKVDVTGGAVDFNTSVASLSSLSLASGSVATGAGGSAETGALDWSGGNVNGKVKSNGSTSVSGANGKTIGTGGELTLAGTGANTWTGGAVTNQGKLNQNAGATDIQAAFANNGELNVGASGGTLKLSGGGSSSGGGNKVSVGSGAKVQVASNYTFDATSFDGAGTVELASATATFKGANGNGKVALNGGNADFSSAVSQLSSLSLVSGAVTSSGAGAAETGALDWTGGSVNGKVKSNGNAGVSGTSAKTIGAGGELTLAGNTTNTWTGGAITNQGKFKQSAGTTDIQTTFDSSGDVTVDSNGGKVKLSGGGKSTGSVSVGANATVEIAGADYTFESGAIDGAGTVDLSAAVTTTLKNTTGSAKLKVSGGTVHVDGAHNGSGKLSLESGKVDGATVTSTATVGTLDWSGGEIATNVTSSGAATISNGQAKKLTGGKLTLGSGATWSGGGIDTSDSATIENNATFATDFDGTITHVSGNRGTFKNNGTFIKSGGGTTATEIQTAFENNGTVSVSAGKLKLSGSGKNGQNAKIEVAAPAELDIASDFELLANSELKGDGLAKLLGGLLTANGKVAIKQLDFEAGSLAGTNLFAGTLNWKGGQWNSDTAATTTVDVGGVLNLSNGSGHEYNRRSIVNKGTVNWHAGNLRGGNGSEFRNEAGGVFNDLNTGNKTLQTPNGVGGFGGTASFTNNGRYNKNATGDTTIEVPFTNTSELVVSAGLMRFSDTFTQTAGTLFVASGATVKFDQSVTFGAGTIGGSGTIQGNVTNAGKLSPGSSPGLMTITGSLALAPASIAFFEIGGKGQGTTYDFLNVGGTTTLGGLLQFGFVNNFHTTVLPTDTFTILTATGGLTGAFSNVADGARLAAVDGLGSFQVNYGVNSVVLSKFTAVPEPSTWALLLSGVGIVGYALRRKRK